jgi:hypothetical protein
MRATVVYFYPHLGTVFGINAETFDVLLEHIFTMTNVTEDTLVADLGDIQYIVTSNWKTINLSSTIMVRSAQIQFTDDEFDPDRPIPYKLTGRTFNV